MIKNYSREVALTLQLTGQTIADCFTLEEIEAEIVLIMAAIRDSRESKGDSFQDGQAQQRTDRQNLTELNQELNAWLKAKGILSGSDSASAELIAANYTGTHR